MTKIRRRMYLLAVAALVLVFAGCKGESPTAPKPTAPGGSVTPPTNATVTVTVSNPTPLVDSTTVVSASVTVDNQPAANGTAVQFQTTLGTFTDANAPVTIRTTTGGTATATLTSSTAGTATITATVNNVAKSAQATFTLKPTTPTPPDTSASISSMTPTTGRPGGGEILTINGKNFVAPVRVLFDLGTGTPKEAQVISASATQIQAITPPVDLGTGQTKNATIIVINNAGTSSEVRITAGTPFTYQAEVLTPKITTISPTSGPIDGGTRVTIFGEGFQAPVQVFFGSATAQVINVTYSQIIAMSPTASSTSPGGSGTVTGPVDLKIINVNSATSVTAPGIFRYTPKMVITAVGPTQGSYLGGTTVRIDGNGFNDPVAVVIGGIAAMPIKVSGTQILAVTGAPVLTGCSNVTGPISVTNVDNGDSATTTSSYTYIVPKPSIVNVSPASQTAGQSLTVTLVNPAAGPAKFTLGDKTVFASSSTANADGTTSYSMTIPTSYTFASAPCTSGGITGTQAQPLTVSVTYTNALLACFTDTAASALTIIPTNTSCVLPPPPAAAVTTPATLTCPGLNIGSTGSGVAKTGTITIANNAATGAQSLTISGVTSTNAMFTVAPTSGTAAPGATVSLTVTFTPSAPAVGAQTSNISFATNDPAKPTISVCVSGTGT